MNSKHILLGFTLVSLVATGPIMAVVESNDKVEQAESAFKTFKKDIKCAFSREGCTRAQKVRMAKRGLKLLGAIALLYGFLRVRTKVMAFRAKAMARDAEREARWKAEEAQLEQSQQKQADRLKALNEQMRQEEEAAAEKAERERPAREARIRAKQKEEEQTRQQRAREEAKRLLQQRVQLKQELLDKKQPFEAQRGVAQEKVDTLWALYDTRRTEQSALLERITKFLPKLIAVPIKETDRLNKLHSEFKQAELECKHLETKAMQVKANLERAEEELERLKKAESAQVEPIKKQISEINLQILELGFEVRES